MTAATEANVSSTRTAASIIVRALRERAARTAVHHTVQMTALVMAAVLEGHATVTRDGRVMIVLNAW